MALVDNAHYVNFGDGVTTGYWGVTKWAVATVYAAGDIRRQSGRAVVTMTSANPGVVTWGGGSAFAHNMTAGDSVVFTTTGALPTNIVSGTTYYLVATIAANTFSVAATPGGTAIDTSAGAQSGVHTGTAMHIGNERIWACVVAGTSHATTEPVWTFTRGVKITDNTVTWQECTGIAALNGDAANTPSWTITATPPGGVKNTAVTLGQVIKRDSGASYQICTTAGTAGNGAEPAFSNTAGTTTADNTVTWTSLGVVGNFTGWQAPHARCQNALTSTWAQAGNKIFARSNNAETQATAITLLGQGTQALPIYLYSMDVNDTALPPTTLLKGASITTSVTSSAAIIIAGGSGANLYFYGFLINSGAGANQATLVVGSAGNAMTTVFDNCTLALSNTSASSLMQLPINGARGGIVTLNNTILSFGAVGQNVNVAGTRTRWTNTASAIGGTVPTALFGVNALAPGSLLIQGVDLSAAGAGKTIISNGISGLNATLVDCKLGASVTVAATPVMRGIGTDVIRADSAATNYQQQRYWYEGTLTPETTIVRTGGATDGATPIAWKIVTTANSNWIEPFESLPIAIWNDTVGSAITVTVYGIATALPNNDDIWLEATYLGSTLTPQASFTTAGTKANNLATGSAQSSDGSTWGGSTTAFKMTLTFTPQMKGPINLVIKAAKVSTTFYIDPKPEISGVSVSKSYIVAPGAYVNERRTGVPQLINAQGLVG